MKSFWRSLVAFEKVVFQSKLLLLALFIFTLIRVPSFFEPYWYGDEAIYLTIGNALNNGKKMYTDIVDHKTPIIYYLARVPDQLSFRLLNYFWGLATIISFYVIAKKVLPKKYWPAISTIFFVLLISNPAIEGNLPNGELFLLGFSLAAMALLTATPFWFNRDKKATAKDLIIYVCAGILFGLATLTKVPAVFEFAVVFVMTAIMAWPMIISREKINKFWPLIKAIALISVGFIATLGASVVYYALLGSLNDYIEFGLLYNFHYTSNWQLSFTQPILVFLFTLPGKVLLIAAISGALILIPNKIKENHKLVIIWMLLSLLASTLSNRPYPHYFLQVVPAASLTIAAFALFIWELIFDKKSRTKNETFYTFAVLILPLFIIYQTSKLLGVYYYSSAGYYKNFTKYVLDMSSKEQYDKQFDSLTTDNAKATAMINELGVKEIFIWGDNAMLYAQSKTVPTSRFTVSFHIEDLKYYDQTFAQIAKSSPKIIVISNDHVGSFPQLEEYVAKNYIGNNNFEHFTLYVRKSNLLQ